MDRQAHRQTVPYVFVCKSTQVYYIQKQKFTCRNILRYVDHIYGMAQLDPTKVKFLDESRKETRSQCLCARACEGVCMLCVVCRVSCVVWMCVLVYLCSL